MRGDADALGPTHHPLLELRELAVLVRHPEVLAVAGHGLNKEVDALLEGAVLEVRETPLCPAGDSDPEAGGGLEQLVTQPPQQVHRHSCLPLPARAPVCVSVKLVVWCTYLCVARACTCACALLSMHIATL